MKYPTSQFQKKNACVFLIPFYVFNFSIHGHSCNPIHFQSCTHGSCFSGSSLWSNSFLLDFIVVWVESPETIFHTYILKTLYYHQTIYHFIKIKNCTHKHKKTGKQPHPQASKHLFIQQVFFLSSYQWNTNKRNLGTPMNVQNQFANIFLKPWLSQKLRSFKFNCQLIWKLNLSHIVRL